MAKKDIEDELKMQENFLTIFGGVEDGNPQLTKKGTKDYGKKINKRMQKLEQQMVVLRNTSCANLVSMKKSMEFAYSTVMKELREIESKIQGTENKTSVIPTDDEENIINFMRTRLKSFRNAARVRHIEPTMIFAELVDNGRMIAYTGIKDVDIDIYTAILMLFGLGEGTDNFRFKCRATSSIHRWYPYTMPVSVRRSKIKTEDGDTVSLIDVDDVLFNETDVASPDYDFGYMLALFHNATRFINAFLSDVTPNMYSPTDDCEMIGVRGIESFNRFVNCHKGGIYNENVDTLSRFGGRFLTTSLPQLETGDIFAGDIMLFLQFIEKYIEIGDDKVTLMWVPDSYKSGMIHTRYLSDTEILPLTSAIQVSTDAVRNAEMMSKLPSQQELTTEVNAIKAALDQINDVEKPLSFIDAVKEEVDRNLTNLSQK